MGRVSIHAGGDKARRKAAETLEGTIIHQRQRELALGRWDFLVFGPSTGARGAVLRVCVAEQMIIQEAQIYLASVGDPDSIGHSGIMAIEELAGGDVSEDLHGLEVYHVAPLRPIAVTDKRRGPDLDRLREKVFEEFSDRNIAIIETPDEAAWSLSALKYLHECDDRFPDPVMSAIRARIRDTSLDLNRQRGLLH